MPALDGGVVPRPPLAVTAISHNDGDLRPREAIAREFIRRVLAEFGSPE